MRAAISIPDDLYEETNELARRQKRSRSEVIRDALREYLARHDADAITEALNRVCDVEDCPTDPAIASASADLLRRVDW